MTCEGESNMATFITTPLQRSGIPLGALGAASIELRPDGEFHEWQITNVQQYTTDCRDIPGSDKGEDLAGSLSFYASVRSANGGTWLRRLGLGFGCGLNHEEYNYRMFSYNKTVEAIEYEGTFPTAQLSYKDRALPVEIRMVAASPFVPYDEQTSATPGFYLTYSITNTSQHPVQVALAGKLRRITRSHEQTNRIYKTADYTTLYMESLDAAAPECEDSGSIALSIAGGDISYITGEYRGYMNEYIPHGAFGVSEESFVYDLHRYGRLSNTNVTQEPNWELPHCIEDYKNFNFGQSILNRILHTEPDAPQTRTEELLEYLDHAAMQLKGMGPWGDGALCSTLDLKPGETQEVRFILSWNYPVLRSTSGYNVGHYYSNLYHNALESSAFLQKERCRILDRVYRFRDAIYKTGLPELYADAVSIHLGTLVKCSWWSKENEFGIWEGLGSCGFHTTDITYHGSFGLVNLFPQLQKLQMRMGARFQREDGRVHHFFTPDFKTVDDGFDRVDMNPQFVLLLCRDYIATGDLEYIKELWPNITAAMASIESLDTDGDGLPDVGTKRNTYDAWNFAGVSTYISLLWLAALKAAAYLADAVGADDLAAHWRQQVVSGTAAVESKLWNGRYYNLWIDGDREDACCMTDQLDGEYFSRIIGLGPILNSDRVRKALESIYELNYTPEGGLVNAAYPEGAKPTLFTYQNCQALANWSGMEYAMAAFYILMNRPDLGETVLTTVDERHLRVGEVWNHMECGDHYYRPLSSWVLMQALSGLTIDGARKSVTLAAFKDYEGPWFGAAGYGTLRITDHALEIRCLEGSLPIQEIHTPANIRAAFYNGAAITGMPDVTLTVGDVLKVEW